MQFEILDASLHFRLHGLSGVVENDRYAEVGLRLMNELWRVVKGSGTRTTGINHWVYLPDHRMFTGVEVVGAQHASVPAPLEPLDFELPRYLKHLHVGPYQELPQKWQALKSALAARGEVMASPSLEIYGHHCDDPAKLETTILMGVQKKSG